MSFDADAYIALGFVGLLLVITGGLFAFVLTRKNKSN